MKLKRIGLILIAIGFVFFGLLSFIPDSRIFDVQATMRKLPENDSDLHDWLLAQPGVIENRVHITRPNDRIVSVTFIMSQNDWHYPPFPKLEQKCIELGYELESPRFLDVDR